MTNYAALAALGLFALAGPAAAQPGPPPSHAEMQARMAEHRAQMDKDVHTVLRLRPEQESTWRAFRDAMHPPGGPDKMISALKPGQTTLQRLDEMGRMAAEHQARHAKLHGALRAFYAALSPEQQAVFDALHRLHGPAGLGGGPRMKMLHAGHADMFDRHVGRHAGPHD